MVDGVDFGTKYFSEVSVFQAFEAAPLPENSSLPSRASNVEELFTRDFEKRLTFFSEFELNGREGASLIRPSPRLQYPHGDPAEGVFSRMIVSLPSFTAGAGRIP
jgi:hypothetical protein